MCSLSLVGDVPTRSDTTFLLISRLECEEVAALLPGFVMFVVTFTSDKVTTNILPGTFYRSNLKDFNRLMKLIWSSAKILSSDHFSVSSIFTLMTMILPR